MPLWVTRRQGQLKENHITTIVTYILHSSDGREHLDIWCLWTQTCVPSCSVWMRTKFESFEPVPPLPPLFTHSAPHASCLSLETAVLWGRDRPRSAGQYNTYDYYTVNIHSPKVISLHYLQTIPGSPPKFPKFPPYNSIYCDFCKDKCAIAIEGEKRF